MSYSDADKPAASSEMAIDEILGRFDSERNAFWPHEVSSALYRAADQKSLEPSQRQAIVIEAAVWELHIREDRNDVWGAYFGPLIEATADDGSAFVRPDIQRMGTAALSTWKARLQRLTHPLIQSFSSEGSGALEGFSGAMADTFSGLEAQMSRAAENIGSAASEITSSLAEIRSAEQDAKESSEGEGSRLMAFAEGLGKSAFTMAQAVLMYRAVNEAINLVGATIAAPFKAVAEGFHYLQDVQERASEVKAALPRPCSCADRCAYRGTSIHRLSSVERYLALSSAL